MQVVTVSEIPSWSGQKVLKEALDLIQNLSIPWRGTGSPQTWLDMVIFKQRIKCVWDEILNGAAR